jgi:hypothetical protein
LNKEQKENNLIRVTGVLSIVGVTDAFRYLKYGAKIKQQVQPQNTFPVSSAQELILVYNADGGIYSRVADIIHKEFFPFAYPCNLRYQTFGTFGMKELWRRFIASLPLKKAALHKDEFKRRYAAENLQLPVLLIRNRAYVQLLVSAAELNQIRSLLQLMEMVKKKLNR